MSEAEVDIFMHRPIQTAELETMETVYKPLAPWIRTI